MVEPLLLRALRRESVERCPVWLMRQAGRYMAEYRAVREAVPFLELCKRPALCAEVMATAVEKLGVDAAIIFSDILPILEPMGFSLSYEKGDGPKIANPFREPSDLKRVQETSDPSALGFVYETVSLTRKLVDPLPVIGFAGAPFTLAGYAIEGETSRNFHRTKRFMHTYPDAWKELLGRLARSIARYLNEQIASGAQVVQIFDSWVGCLGVEDFRAYVLPALKELRAAIASDALVVYFGTGNPALLPSFKEINADCYGVDWRTPLAFARETLGSDCAIQGNLDPVVLLSTPEVIRREAARVLQQVDPSQGYIFNLGHGVLKETPVENAILLVETVKEYGARSNR